MISLCLDLNCFLDFGTCNKINCDLGVFVQGAKLKIKMINKNSRMTRS